MSVGSVISVLSAVVSCVTGIFNVWTNKLKNNNTDAMKARDRAGKIAELKTRTREDFDKGDVESIQKAVSK